MIICRSIKSLTSIIPNSSNKSRSFFTTNSTIIQSPFAPLHYYYYYPSASSSPSNRFLSKWIFLNAPFQAPLFLSSPPWKLLQSSMPLYLRGNAIVLRKVEAFNLHLLRSRVGSGYAGQGVLSNQVDLVKEEEVVDGGVKDAILESFVNLPNFISISRLVSGPLIGWMITNEMYSSAFVALAIAGASDWLDGYVARKMNIDSVVGSYLDPLADKVLIGSVALAMVHMDLLHPGLVGLVVLRDVALVCGAVYHRAGSLGWKWTSWYDFFNLDGTRPEKVEPLFISKVNTVFQLVLVAAALIQPEFGTQETLPYITYLSWVVAGTTFGEISAQCYGHQKHKAKLC
ncbi:hypothetical protein DKX38_005395 [Salix brachista]|uniref:CDP-diacylglycerol--glycerol-3-phosphate 3-phosphatidyltransferase n=1 Tax=Salix brachista TaxID=2182728 RepID=A0A5N5N0D8_9ROSI|nr:hypothetical protein DKX38_005395 [Salix brachista]